MKNITKTFIRAAALVVFAATCTGCIKNTNANTFIIANGTEKPVLNPAEISTAADERIYRAIFEGLVSPDPVTGDAVPALAESWQLDKGARRITFTLRQAKWSDGKQITAQNVVDSWFYLMENSKSEANRSLMGELISGAQAYMNNALPKEKVGIAALDDQTLRIDFATPRADAVQQLLSSAFAVLPMHLINEKPENWAESSTIVTNGAFKVSGLSSDGTLTLLANSKYWNKDSVSLARIIFLKKGADSSTFKDFKDGKISWIPDIPFEKIGEVKSNPYFVSTPKTAVHYYYLNVNHKTLCNAKVRQAVNLAIDRNALVDTILGGNGEPCASLVPPRKGWKEVQLPEFDVEKAKKLLAESGFAKSKDIDEIILGYNEESAIYKATAEFIADSLKKNLGINVTVQASDWESFATKRRANGFDMARGGWQSSINEPTGFLLQLVSTDKENAGRYNNPAFDSLLRTASRTTENAERLAILHEAENIAVAEDAAILPLYFEKSYQLINTTLWQGWYANPADIHTFSSIKLKDVELTK